MDLQEIWRLHLTPNPQLLIIFKILKLAPIGCSPRPITKIFGRSFFWDTWPTEWQGNLKLSGFAERPQSTIPVVNNVLNIDLSSLFFASAFRRSSTLLSGLWVEKWFCHLNFNLNWICFYPSWAIFVQTGQMFFIVEKLPFACFKLSVWKQINYKNHFPDLFVQMTLSLLNNYWPYEINIVHIWKIYCTNYTNIVIFHLICLLSTNKSHWRQIYSRGPAIRQLVLLPLNVSTISEWHK